MKSTHGQILKIYPPKWTYTIRVHYIKNEDGTINVYLTYADGTPLSEEDAREFLIEKGWIQE